MDSEWPSFPRIASGIFVTMRTLQISLNIAVTAILVNSIKRNPFGSSSSLYVALVPTCIAMFVGITTVTVAYIGRELNPLASASVDLTLAVLLAITQVFPQVKLNSYGATCNSLKSGGWDGCSLVALILALSYLGVIFWIATAGIAIRAWLRQRAFTQAQMQLDRIAAQRAEQFNMGTVRGDLTSRATTPTHQGTLPSSQTSPAKSQPETSGGA